MSDTIPILKRIDTMKAKKVIAMLLAATLSVTAFTGCSINKTATVATLDKEDIKLGLVNFMIRYQ